MTKAWPGTTTFHFDTIWYAILYYSHKTEYICKVVKIDREICFILIFQVNFEEPAALVDESIKDKYLDSGEPILLRARQEGA